LRFAAAVIQLYRAFTLALQRGDPLKKEKLLLRINAADE
jgi:hypothetical protein